MNQLQPRSTALGVGKASIYTVLAGIFLAVCQVLDQLLVSGAARTVLSVVLGAAAAYGIQPLFGPALTNLLHIPTQVLFFVAAIVAGLTGVVSALAMSDALHSILGAVLTMIGALVFGSPILTPGPRRPA